MPKSRYDRRGFLVAAASTVACTGFSRIAGVPAKTTQVEPHGYFTLGKCHGHWFFMHPQATPFFSIGLNHIDPSSLRYPENVSIWRTKYGASVERWLKEAVRPDLQRWGFNTAGWVQEVVTRGPTNHRHSRSFTYEEYQWLDMPYCHLLPFADFHQWEAETRNPDLYSDDFAQWCDFVARQDCAQLADDPKLIGYFYLDCPTWVHTTKWSAWKGPLFDPDRLKSEAGRRALSDLAGRYYKVTHDAIRRYDKHHLILGDRYEGRASLPVEILKAALPYVDVLSFQHFSTPEQILSDFQRWHELTGKPVLLADAARRRPLPDGTLGLDPKWYRETIRMLREMDACVGFHLCGAYVRNRCRRAGLLDEQEQPDQEAVEAITEANRETIRWLNSPAEPLHQ